MSNPHPNIARPSSPVESNGEMANRVQQLRLGNQLGAGKGGSGGGASWLPWLLCLLLAGTWALVGIRGYRNPETGATGAEGLAVASTDRTASSTNSAGSSSNSSSPAPVAGTVQLEVKGYIMPAQQIAVSPIDVGGRLIVQNVVEGRFYEKGAILAKIEPASYQALVDEAQASHTAAEQKLIAARKRLEELTAVYASEKIQMTALIEEAKAARERTASEWTRVSNLGGGISPLERVQARTDWEAAEARLKKLEADQQILLLGRPARIAAASADVAGATAEVTAAEARVAQATWRLTNCTICAPISGSVLSKKAELGNLVNPMAFSASTSGGGAVCDMADLRDLEVDIKIAERDISKLVVGQPCRIRADAYQNLVYTGRLDRIMPIANRADSTVNVRVKVNLPEGEKPGTYLKPEMGAVVSFLPGK